MKSTRDDGVKVSILDREFFVGCPDDQRDQLSAAASYLDKQMRQIQRAGKVVGADRCAIMAALNITHDLLQMRAKLNATSEIHTRLKAIQEKIDSVMQEDKQLTL